MSYHKKAKLRHISIAATAGNVATNLSPTAGYRWEILYGEITLVNDATVANRSVYIEPQLSTGTEVTAGFYNTTAYTAGQTRRIKFGQHLDRIIDISILNTNSFASIKGWVIEGTDRLNITINNGQAGDSYSGSVTVYEIKL